MWSTETEASWIGDILQQLNEGKTIGGILLACTSWRRRARILLNLKKIKKCHQDFLAEITK